MLRGMWIWVTLLLLTVVPLLHTCWEWASTRPRHPLLLPCPCWPPRSCKRTPRVIVGYKHGFEKAGTASGSLTSDFDG